MLGALAYSIQENLGQENLGLFPESNFNLIGRVFSFTVFWLSLTLAPSTIVIWNSFNAGEEAIDKSRLGCEKPRGPGKCQRGEVAES